MAIPLCTITLVAMAAVFVAMDTVEGNWSRYEQNQYQRDMRAWDESRALYGRKKKDVKTEGQRSSERQKSIKPNIIFVLTDDQDIALGSMDAMPKTRRILGGGGATFPNAFVTTPICCPSRSSMLTGLYVHNHNVYTNNDNCSSPMWQQTHETRNFGTYLSNAGYRTGYFGKYLNDYDGEHIPPGWTEWMGLIRNTRFYNYTVNFNGKHIKHGDSYKDDYLTDLIANDSVAFMKQSKQFFPNRPVAMVLSMPAPHGPEDAAPQYQDLYRNVTTHRTDSWNFAPNPDKQWLLQYTGKMEPIHIAFTDLLQRKRLQTLRSVDDAVEKVYKELKELGELDNTYWLFTSDHGYHIGQYGLVKGKSMPYDFDVRVPFYMRGPNIPPGITVNNIVLNVDIAPTLLDAGGVTIPEHMDGKSVLELFAEADKQKSISNGVLKQKKAWRDTFLIERGKITEKKVKNRERIEAQKNIMILTKQYRLRSECDKGEYQPPCNGTQQWVCRQKPNGNLRIFKCRYGRKEENEVSPKSKCHCPPGSKRAMNRSEKKRQRQFLRNHVNQPEMLKAKFMRPNRRLRRSLIINNTTGGSTVLDQPPFADPGPSYILSLPQNSVTLDGRGSTDDNGIVGYRWTMLSHGISADIMGTRTPRLRLTNLQAGDYILQLTVTDTVGQTDSQVVHVKVKPDKSLRLKTPATSTATQNPVMQNLTTTPPEKLEHANSKKVRHTKAPIGQGIYVTTSPIGQKGNLAAASEADQPIHDQLEASSTPKAEKEPSPNTKKQPVGPQNPDNVDVLDYGNPDSNYDEYSEYYFVNPDSSQSGSSDRRDQTEVSHESTGGAPGQSASREAKAHPVSCRVLPNKTVVCEEEIYSSLGAWENEKDSLDAQIARLKAELDKLKDVKKHLRSQRPEDVEEPSSSENYGIDPNQHAPDQAPGGSTEYDTYGDYEEDLEDLLDYSKGGSTGDLNMEELLEEFYEEPSEVKAGLDGTCVCEENPKNRGHRPTQHGPASHHALQHDLPRSLSPRQQKRQERQDNRDKKKLEREVLRQQKQLLRQMKRDNKKKENEFQEPVTDPTRDCNSKNMKCFTQDNEHWKSAPLWDYKKVGRRRDPNCHKEGMECTRMDNYHWEIPPYWTLGPFCFCPNSNNNTYWCLRTINQTHDFLYCEFITGFISYYDMTKDPYQLRNAVYDLSYPMLQEMHELLEKLKGCSGPRECTMRYRTEDEKQGAQSKPEKRRRKTKPRNKGNSVVLQSDQNVPQWARRRGN